MLGEGRSTPARREFSPRALPADHHLHEGYHMSSAPSTLMRRKSPTDMSRNQRAVWSSAAIEESSNSINSTSDSVRATAAHMEENQPIVSMPSPSPSILQQQTQEVQ